MFETSLDENMLLDDIFLLLSEQMVNEVLKNKRSIEGKDSHPHIVCFDVNSFVIC